MEFTTLEVFLAGIWCGATLCCWIIELDRRIMRHATVR